MHLDKYLIDKLYNLKEFINRLEKIIVAYSGGVDSTFLLKVSNEVLGNNCIGVIVISKFLPDREIEKAIENAQLLNFELKILDYDIIKNNQILKNSPDRCYYCKLEIFKKIIEFGKSVSVNNILEASNYDDLNDYRPGFKALKELNIKSPLIDFKFSKSEIRELSRFLGLPAWNKESFSCLASRFAYNTPIEIEKLLSINRIEEFLINNGIHNVRARHFGKLLKIEVNQEDINKIVKNNLRKTLIEYAKKEGYLFVALDLEGYKTGSLNQLL